MVRRSSVAEADSDAQPTAHGDGTFPSPGLDDRAPGRSPWRGGGGRWLLWPMRVVLWAAVLVIGYRGVMAIALNETPASNGSATNPGSAPQFPVTLAEAYALEFGQVYLNFNPQNATERASELANYLPTSITGANPEFGWNGQGTARLDSEQLAGVSVQSRQNAVVTLLASVNGQLMELGVPVYASGGSLVISGEPAWLPAPSAAQLPSPAQANSDPVAQNQLMSQLPAFFEAYASGDAVTLQRFLAPGASLNGLGGAVTFTSIANMTVPPGGATRDITVTVNWQLAGQGGSGTAQLAATYTMTVVDQQSGKWYVKDISASTQPMGSQ